MANYLIQDCVGSLNIVSELNNISISVACFSKNRLRAPTQLPKMTRYAC